MTLCHDLRGDWLVHAGAHKLEHNYYYCAINYSQPCASRESVAPRGYVSVAVRDTRRSLEIDTATNAATNTYV